MFIKLENGMPVGSAISESNLRLLYPNTSFAWPFIPEDIEHLGLGLYDFSSSPTTGIFEKVVEVRPEKDEYGIWRQTWQIVPMTQEEQELRIQQEWRSIRALRDSKLVQSDWTQFSDVTLSVDDRLAWESYRAELRNVPNLQTDPFNIIWPDWQSIRNSVDNITPTRVTTRQAREALIRRGLFDQVESAINAIPDQGTKAVARNSWEYSNAVEVDNATTQMLAMILGLDQEAKAELLRFAAKL